MSGPKCFGYEVQQRFNRAFRTIHRLAFQVDRIAAHWQAMCQEHEEVPPWTSDLPRLIEDLLQQKLTPEKWEEAGRDLATQLAPLRVEYENAQKQHAKARAAEAKALREQTKGQLQASLRKAVAAHRQAEAAASPTEREAKDARYEAERHVEQVTDVLGTLADDASSEDRSAVVYRAEEASSAPPGRRNALLMQLRSDIQRANAKVEARRLARQQAVALREELAGFAGAEVEQLDATLQQVADGSGALPQDMERQVAEAVARATERRNRDYVMEVVAEELQNLGYVVEEGFETASADTPQMLLRGPEMADDYHVALSADPATARLEAKVVREADGETGRRDDRRKRLDQQVETAWCGDVAAALAAAENQGVSARVVSRHAPGEVPVETIAPFTKKGRPQTRRRRDQMRRTRRQERQMSR